MLSHDTPTPAALASREAAEDADVLSPTEQRELDRHEACLSRCVADAGAALRAIRDGKLYREQYASFGDYLSEKWGVTLKRAYQQIAAVAVIENIAGDSAKADFSTSVDKLAPPQPPVALPTNEAQTRPLSPLEPAEQREAWREAVASAPKDAAGQAKVTGPAVKKAAERVQARRKPPASTKPAAAPKEEAGAPTEPLEPWAEFVGDVGGVLTTLRSASRRLRDLLDFHPETRKPRAPFAYFMTQIGTASAIDQVVRDLEKNLPAATSKKPPGFITVGQSKDAERFHKSKR